MLQTTFCPQIQQQKSLKWPWNLYRLGYASEIFGIFYSQWEYQMLNILGILKFLTWHDPFSKIWEAPLQLNNF